MRILAGLSWTWCFAEGLFWIFTTGPQIAPRVAHRIDGVNFAQGALDMIQNGSWLVTADTYHCVPMQV